MSEIEAANLKFMTAFGKQDATGLSELYTEDCKLMPTGTDVLFGREGAYVFVVSQSQTLTFCVRVWLHETNVCVRSS